MTNVDAHGDYGIADHAHRFAVWAAARSVQRRAKGAKSKALAQAFSEAKLRSEFEEAALVEWNQASFDVAHREWCERLQRSPPDMNLSFGRAAKFVAVYLKAAYVLREPKSSFALHIHPPIDRALLQAIPKSFLDEAGLKNGAWTTFGPEDYRAAVSALRAWMPNVAAFWEIEAHWNPVAA